MKRNYTGILIILLLVLAITESYAKPTKTPNLPMVNGRICYTNIVTTDSTLTKDALYIRARAWFARSFGSSKAVIEMEDKEGGNYSWKGYTTRFSSCYGI